MRNRIAGLWSRGALHPHRRKALGLSGKFELMSAVLDWLIQGDPSIRWQVMRDLLDEPWEAERSKVAQHGDGAKLLALQDKEGTWGGGIYSPKWISTTY